MIILLEIIIICLYKYNMENELACVLGVTLYTEHRACICIQVYYVELVLHKNILSLTCLWLALHALAHSALRFIQYIFLSHVVQSVVACEWMRASNRIIIAVISMHNLSTINDNNVDIFRRYLKACVARIAILLIILCVDSII